MLSKTKQTELPQILHHPLPPWKSQDNACQAGNTTIWSRKTPLRTVLKVITIKGKWLEINIRAKPINVYIMNSLFRTLKLMTLFFQTLFSRVLWVLQYLFTFFNKRSVKLQLGCCLRIIFLHRSCNSCLTYYMEQWL